MTDQEPEKKRPQNLREGSLNLAVWRNATEKGTRFNTELTRSYCDADGQWHKTHTLREQDQLTASNLQRRGHDYITRQKQELARQQRVSQQGQSQDRGPRGPSR